MVCEARVPPLTAKLRHLQRGTGTLACATWSSCPLQNGPELFERHGCGRGRAEILLHVFEIAHAHQGAGDAGRRSHKLDGALRVRLACPETNSRNSGGSPWVSWPCRRLALANTISPCALATCKTGPSFRPARLGAGHGCLRHGEVKRQLDGAEADGPCPPLLPPRARHRSTKGLRRKSAHSVGVPGGRAVHPYFAFRYRLLQRRKGRP